MVSVSSSSYGISLWMKSNEELSLIEQEKNNFPKYHLEAINKEIESTNMHIRFINDKQEKKKKSFEVFVKILMTL